MFSQEEDTKQPIRDSLEESRDRTAKKRASRYYRFSICTVSQLSWPTFGGSYCTGWFIWSDSWVGLTWFGQFHYLPGSAWDDGKLPWLAGQVGKMVDWWSISDQRQPNPTIRPVGNSSVSVCFVSTKWAYGSFLFDYMGQWELLI